MFVNIFDAIVDGNGNELSTGGIIALISIAAVFVILAAIIFITWFVNTGINSVGGLFKNRKKNVVKTESNEEKVSVDINDEDGFLKGKIDITNRHALCDFLEILSVNSDYKYILLTKAQFVKLL